MLFKIRIKDKKLSLLNPISENSLLCINKERKINNSLLKRKYKLKISLNSVQEDFLHISDKINYHFHVKEHSFLLTYHHKAL